VPITPLHTVRRLTQEEFAALSYEVMGCVFEIHREYGRFFDEKIYKRELAARFPRVEIEFPIGVTHKTFSTTYYLDALVADGGAFEFKAVEALTPQHRGQLYNYLLLLDLAHGKLVNLRPESVQHEFVNALSRPAERRVFSVVTERWDASLPGAGVIAESLLSALRDWGTGLELTLYESALTHFLGGPQAVLQKVAVQGSQARLGYQSMRLAAPGVAFKFTALEAGLQAFEEHARRLLAHVELKAILWVNIALHTVTLTSIH
jgi:GxxExxY protein